MQVTLAHGFHTGGVECDFQDLRAPNTKKSGLSEKSPLREVQSHGAEISEEFTFAGLSDVSAVGGTSSDGCS